MAQAQSASTPRTRAPRGSRASAKTGAAQNANAGNLSTAQNATSLPEADKLLQQQSGSNGTQAAPQQTNDANLVMPHAAHTTLVTHIKAVTAGLRAALNEELAVACIVFIDAGGTDLKAKKELYSVYADAGYDCKVGGDGKDYKTVNRRIGYAAQFFDSLEKDSLKAVMGEARDDAAIQTLVTHFSTKYNFRNMQDVQAASGVIPAGRRPNTGGGNTDNGGGQPGAGGSGGQPSGGGAANENSTSVFRTSATATPTGQPSPADLALMGEISAAGANRVGDPFADTSKWLKVEFEGATIVLPTDMKTESLADLGIKLMTAAKDMHGASTVVGAVLKDMFKEAVAAH